MRNRIEIVGVYNIEVPPVPIPNTVVKLNCAEDTWREAARENRSSPEQKKKQTSNSLSVFLFNEINPFGICEIRFACEILLRNVKYDAADGGFILLHIERSEILHNPSGLFHIFRKENISFICLFFNIVIDKKRNCAYNKSVEAKTVATHR